MGQNDIINVLKKNKGWMRTDEIAKCLNITSISANRNLVKLREFQIVKYKITPRNQGNGGNNFYLYKLI